MSDKKWHETVRESIEWTLRLHSIFSILASLGLGKLLAVVISIKSKMNPIWTTGAWLLFSAALLPVVARIAPELFAQKVPSLKDKSRQLGLELFKFLREKGPEPIESGAPIGVLHDRLMTYRTALHFGYEAKFRVRVNTLYSELRERHLHSDDINTFKYFV
jgi:hypothetical protein